MTKDTKKTAISNILRQTATPKFYLQQMEWPEHLQTIVDKVEAGEKLTDEDELTYFTKIMGYSEEDAKRLFYIVDNQQPGVFID